MDPHPGARVLGTVLLPKSNEAVAQLPKVGGDSPSTEVSQNRGDVALRDAGSGHGGVGDLRAFFQPSWYFDDGGARRMREEGRGRQREDAGMEPPIPSRRARRGSACDSRAGSPAPIPSLLPPHNRCGRTPPAVCRSGQGGRGRPRVPSRSPSRSRGPARRQRGALNSGGGGGRAQRAAPGGESGTGTGSQRGAGGRRGVGTAPRDPNPP